MEAKLGCDMGFHARIDVGEGADRAGDGAGRNLLARRDEARLRAVELGVKARELDAERRRLGVDAMAAADGDGILELERTPLQRSKEVIDIGDEDVGGAL